MGESPSSNVVTPPGAYATVIHQVGYRHVRFAGGTAREPDDVAGQVRTILERRECAFADRAGSLDDVVMSRYFVLADHLSRETQARVHEVRDERFDSPETPHDRWKTAVLTGDDAGR